MEWAADRNTAAFTGLRTGFEFLFPFSKKKQSPQRATASFVVKDCYFNKNTRVVTFRNTDTLLPFWFYSFLQVKSSNIRQPSPNVSLSRPPFLPNSFSPMG